MIFNVRKTRGLLNVHMNLLVLATSPMHYLDNADKVQGSGWQYLSFAHEALTQLQHSPKLGLEGGQFQAGSKDSSSILIGLIIIVYVKYNIYIYTCTSSIRTRRGGSCLKDIILYIYIIYI